MENTEFDSQRPPSELLAFHEAGHVAVYLNSGLSFRYVTIENSAGPELAYVEPSEEYAKIAFKVKNHLTLDDEEKRHLLLHVPVFFGGPMAEGRYVNADEWWRYESTGNDLRAAIGYLEYLNGTHSPEVRNIIDKLKKDVRELLKKREVWNYIKIIAGELVRLKTLTQIDCQALYRR